MPRAHFATVSDARAGFKDMIDAAHQGGAGVVHRAGEAYALVPLPLIRDQLMASLDTSPEVFREDGAIGLSLSGMPFASEGATLEDAAADMLDALREYAEDWPRLRQAPNHARMSRLVPFIDLSTDEQLLEWLTGAS